MRIKEWHLIISMFSLQEWKKSLVKCHTHESVKSCAWKKKKEISITHEFQSYLQRGC